MISVAAELAAMHPQTLRLYERRGLLAPQRSAKNTRRYSRDDVARLRRIQELTELGLNLAGVERVLAMEEQLTAMSRRCRPRGALRGRRACARGRARERSHRLTSEMRGQVAALRSASDARAGEHRRCAVVPASNRRKKR